MGRVMLASACMALLLAAGAHQTGGLGHTPHSGRWSCDRPPFSWQFVRRQGPAVQLQLCTMHQKSIRHISVLTLQQSPPPNPEHPSASSPSCPGANASGKEYAPTFWAALGKNPAKGMSITRKVAQVSC